MTIVWVLSLLVILEALAEPSDAAISAAVAAWRSDGGMRGALRAARLAELGRKE